MSTDDKDSSRDPSDAPEAPAPGASSSDASSSDASSSDASSSDASSSDASSSGGAVAAGSHRAAAEAAEEAFFGAEGELEDDDVDPELLRLPRRRRRRHPIVGLAVIGLSVYLMASVRHDLLFYFQPSVPADLGEATEAVKRGAIEDNRFVTVRGAPDRKHALILQGRITGYDSFFRLLQTSSRVFVQEHRRRRTVDRELSYVHTGRVVRFASLPYQQALAKYFRRAMSTVHDLSLDALRRAKEAGGATVAVRDQQGDEVVIRPEQLIWINAVHAQEWVVQLSKRFYPSQTEAEEQLEGVDLPWAVDTETSKSFWRLVVLADENQVKVLMDRFKDPQRHGQVVRRQVSYTAKWDQLDVQADRLVINDADPTFPPRFRRVGEGSRKLEPVRSKAIALPRSSVLYISVAGRFTVPDDAVVIVTEQQPSDYWYYLVLYLILTTFIGINVVALASRLRGRSG